MINTKLMSSLAILRKLYDTKRNIYAVLYDFIISIVTNYNIFKFTSIEMKNLLNKYYGFNIPESVIKTALKNKNSDFTKSYGKYEIKEVNNIKSKVKSDIDEFLDINNDITDVFLCGIGKLLEKRDFSNKEKDEIIESLSIYLLENRYNDIKYGTEIHNVILHHENDINFVQHLNRIREGLILYQGLTYSIDINSIGSWKDNITIYLDTSVLFHAAGYNGTLFKELFYDFYKLVKEINDKSINQTKKKVIKLKYFQETKNQILGYFTTAENIVEKNQFFNSDTAMELIIRNCKTRSDITGKQADFFLLIKKLGIEEESKTDFFEEENYKYNIDFGKLSSKFNINETIEKSKVDIYSNIMQHINVLRKGNSNKSFEKIGYIFLSTNSNILYVARDKDIKKDNDIALVIDLDYITNMFWFKLNKGFGNNTPINIDIINQTRKVFSNSFNKLISTEYEELRYKYKNGDISEEELIEKFIILKEKMILPENIKDDNIDELYTSISSDNLENILRERDSDRAKITDLENKDKKNTDYIEKLCDRYYKLENDYKKIKEKLESFENEEKLKKAKLEKVKKITCMILKITLISISISAILYYILINYTNILKELINKYINIPDIVNGVIIFIIIEPLAFLVRYTYVKIKNRRNNKIK